MEISTSGVYLLATTFNSTFYKMKSVFASGLDFCQKNTMLFFLGAVLAFLSFQLILILIRCLQDKGRTELRVKEEEEDIVFKPAKYKEVLTTAREPPVSLLDMAKLSFRPGYAQEIIRITSQNNYNVNLPVSSDGLSLFMCSCLGGESELIKFLLKRGGDVYQKTAGGNSVLYLATFGVLNRANIRNREIIRGRTDVQLLELLIRKGSNVNGRNELGFTALHLAVAHRNTDIIKCLLRNQASPFVTSKSGISPLHLAASSGFSDVVQFMQNYIAED